MQFAHGCSDVLVSFLPHVMQLFVWGCGSMVRPRHLLQGNGFPCRVLRVLCWLLQVQTLVGARCGGVVLVFRVGCVGSLSWVCRFIVCMRFLMAISAGCWCWFGVIGFVGIGALCRRNASVRVIELLIIFMADFRVMGLFLLGLCWVNGNLRGGWLTSARSRVLVSFIACWKWWHWVHHGVWGCAIC